MEYPHRTGIGDAMYGKVFAQILDSSIADDYLTRFVFEDFIVLADADGVVDMTQEAMSRRTNVPIEIIQRAIVRLEAPDPRSRNPAEQGRRIVRLDEHRDWGWRIVNHAHYRGLRTDVDRRDYMRYYMRERRKGESVNTKANKSLRELTPASASVYASESVLGESRGGSRFQRPTVEQVREHCSAKGYTFDPEAFVAFYESKGWRIGKEPMKSWRAACVTWHKRSDVAHQPPVSRIPLGRTD
jgi:hypothetical protein